MHVLVLAGLVLFQAVNGSSEGGSPLTSKTAATTQVRPDGAAEPEDVA